MPSRFRTIFLDAFGTVEYDFGLPGGRGEYATMTNFTKAIEVYDGARAELPFYLWYNILHGERPDTLSHFLYDDPKYYWIFFLINPHLRAGLSAWPKTDLEMDDYIRKEYDGWMWISADGTADEVEYWSNLIPQEDRASKVRLGNIPFDDKFLPYLSLTTASLNYIPTDMTIRKYQHNRHGMFVKKSANPIWHRELELWNDQQKVYAIVFDDADKPTDSEEEKALRASLKEEWISKAATISGIGFQGLDNPASSSPRDTDVAFEFEASGEWSREESKNAIYEFYYYPDIPFERSVDEDDRNVLSHYDVLNGVTPPDVTLETNYLRRITFAEYEYNRNDSNRRIKVPRVDIVDELYDNYIALIGQ